MYHKKDTRQNVYMNEHKERISNSVFHRHTDGALALKINGKIRVISLSLLTLTFDANIYNVKP